MTNPEGQDINDFIQQLHRVSLDRQRAANKVWKQWDKHHWLVSEETRLIQQLAAIQWDQQQTRDFAVGDQVVIKNLNLSWVRGTLNAANWQGIITSVTPFHTYFCGDSGCTMHCIWHHICYAVNCGWQMPVNHPNLPCWSPWQMFQETQGLCHNQWKCHQQTNIQQMYWSLITTLASKANNCYAKG